MNDFDFTSFVTQVMETFSNLYTSFTLSLDELVARAGITVEIPFIGDWTLFGLMIGGGIFIYFVVCLVGWLSPL